MDKRKRKKRSGRSEPGPKTCNLCGKPFESAVELFEHNLQDHSETEPEIWPRTNENAPESVERYLGVLSEPAGGRGRK